MERSCTEMGNLRGGSGVGVGLRGDQGLVWEMLSMGVALFDSPTEILYEQLNT